MISFYLPERKIGDYLAASKLYYDPNHEDSHIDAPYKELLTDRRTPWVISLKFDNKKLTSKVPWIEIQNKIERIF